MNTYDEFLRRYGSKGLGVPQTPAAEAQYAEPPGTPEPGDVQVRKLLTEVLTERLGENIARAVTRLCDAGLSTDPILAFSELAAARVLITRELRRRAGQ